MSHSINYLHSHSGIEREVRMPKFNVLVDARYKNMFLESKPFMYYGTTYYKVNTLEFANKGGVFKNLSR